MNKLLLFGLILCVLVGFTGVSSADHNKKCSANFFSVSNSNDAWNETNADCGFFQKSSRWMFRLINDSNDVHIAKSRDSENQFEIEVNDEGTYQYLKYKDNDTRVLKDDTVENTLHIPKNIRATFKNNRDGAPFNYIGFNNDVHSTTDHSGLANKEYLEEFWIKLYNQDGETIRENININNSDIVENWDKEDLNTSNPNRINILRDWSFREHPSNKNRYKSSIEEQRPSEIKNKSIIPNYNSIMFDSLSLPSDASLVPSLRGEGELGYIKNKDVVDVDYGSSFMEDDSWENTRSINQGKVNPSAIFNNEPSPKESYVLTGQAYTAIYSIDPSTVVYPERNSTSGTPPPRVFNSSMDGDDNENAFDSKIMSSYYDVVWGPTDDDDDKNTVAYDGNLEVHLVGQEKTTVNILVEEHNLKNKDDHWDGIGCSDEYDSYYDNIDSEIETTFYANGNKVTSVPGSGKKTITFDPIDYVSNYKYGLGKLDLNVETTREYTIESRVKETEKSSDEDDENDCETDNVDPDWKTSTDTYSVNTSDMRRLWVEDLSKGSNVDPMYTKGVYKNNGSTISDIRLPHGWWSRVQDSNGRRIAYNTWRITSSRDARWDKWEKRQIDSDEKMGSSISIFDNEEVSGQFKLYEIDQIERPPTDGSLEIQVLAKVTMAGGDYDSRSKCVSNDDCTLDLQRFSYDENCGSFGICSNNIEYPGDEGIVVSGKVTSAYEGPEEGGWLFNVEVSESTGAMTGGKDFEGHTLASYCWNGIPLGPSGCRTGDVGKGKWWSVNSLGKNLVDPQSNTHDVFPLVTRAFPSYNNDSEDAGSSEYPMTLYRNFPGELKDVGLWKGEILSPNMSKPMSDCEPIPDTRDPDIVAQDGFEQDCNYVFEVRRTDEGPGFLDLYDSYSLPQSFEFTTSYETSEPLEVVGLVQNNTAKFASSKDSRYADKERKVEIYKPYIEVKQETYEPPENVVYNIKLKYKDETPNGIDINSETSGDVIVKPMKGDSEVMDETKTPTGTREMTVDVSSWVKDHNVSEIKVQYTGSNWPTHIEGEENEDKRAYSATYAKVSIIDEESIILSIIKLILFLSIIFFLVLIPLIIMSDEQTQIIKGEMMTYFKKGLLISIALYIIFSYILPAL